MKVSDLIRLLQQQDPDARVTIVYQRNLPLESHVHGVAVRGNFSDECDCGGEDGEHVSDCPQSDEYEDGEPSDVFILEGEHLGYGNAEAWEVVRQ